MLVHLAVRSQAHSNIDDLSSSTVATGCLPHIESPSYC